MPSHNLYRWVGYLEKLYVAPDSNGWCKILDLADGWMAGYLLLNWPSHQYSDGLYEVDMELANSSKSVVHATGAVKMRIDNSKPLPKFNGLRWRISGSTAWHSVGLICPVIPRPVGQDIEIEVSYEASADHLRSMILTGNGCGAGNNLELVSGINSARWWHRNAADNYEAKKRQFFFSWQINFLVLMGFTCLAIVGRLTLLARRVFQRTGIWISFTFGAMVIWECLSWIVNSADV